MCLIYARHSSESFKYLFIKSVHLHNNTVIIIPLASSVAQLVKNLPAMQETPVQFLGQEDLLRRDRLPTPVFLGFLGGSDSKESACNVGCLGLIPGMGRFPGKGNGYPPPWRREWLPMPVFLSGEFREQRSLAGYSSQGHKEQHD